FKQYGILNFVPFLLFVAVSGSKDWRKNLLLFFSGGLFSAVFFFIYFLIVEKIPFKDLILQLSGQGYGEKGLVSEKSFISILIGAKVFLLIVLSIIFNRFSFSKNKLNQFLLAGIFVNLIPVQIQHFPHY